MRCGYACLTIGVRNTALKTCRQDRADETTLMRLIKQNLEALTQMLLYNEAMGIRLFRISSDLIPFGSSPVNQLPWSTIFAETLNDIAEIIRRSGQRVSMHPGQYTVLNTIDEDVLARSLADLQYHALLLDTLGTGTDSKIILHIGGIYGDKPAAMARFAARYPLLDPAVRRRLVIENDERLFTVADALQLNEKLGIPVVFDNLHHALNQPSNMKPATSDNEWLMACRRTWQAADGPQKIHYSQQAEGKKAGAHSDTIRSESFLRDMALLPQDLDIMLEVKDKNLSAVKGNHLLRENGPIRMLEEEWQRYKYEVLEHDPARYLAIRHLLKDKSAWPAQAFYQMVEEAQMMPVTAGHGVNAAQHVWGYLNEGATAAEKVRFKSCISRYEQGVLSSGALKSLLCRIAARQKQPYLLNSLYLARQC